MIPLYFCAESPSPTETDSEDEVIFNRILKVNKGNATKDLLIMGLSLVLLGVMWAVQCLTKIRTDIFPILHTIM